MMDRDEDRAVRYLLDELPAADREAFEEQYFGDEEAYAALLAAEDELIDRYCEGGLGDPLRGRFEHRYLATPEGRERVEFARALKRRASERPAVSRLPDAPAGPRTAPRWLPWAAVVLFGVGGLGFGAGQSTDARQARRERAAALERMAQQQQRQRDQDRRLGEMYGQLDRLQQQVRTVEDMLGGSAARTISIALASGLRRDAATLARLVLTSDITVVRLTLLLEAAPRPAYRASLQTPEGRELWSRDGLAPAPSGEQSAVTFTVPAALLPPGHYVVTLGPPRGESDAEYVFEVRR
jgi:hypothetical protein